MSRADCRGASCCFFADSSF